MATQNEQNRKYMEWHKKEGLCLFCPELQFGQSSLCEKHYFCSISASAMKDRTQWEKLKELFYGQDERCYLSGRKLIPGKNASIDHIVPISKEKKYKIENLRWCDNQVNHAKNNMRSDEFIALCKEIVNYTSNE